MPFLPLLPSTTTTLLLKSLFHLFPSRSLFLNLRLSLLSSLLLVHRAEEEGECPARRYYKGLSDLYVFAGDDVSFGSAWKTRKAEGNSQTRQCDQLEVTGSSTENFF